MMTMGTPIYGNPDVDGHLQNINISKASAISSSLGAREKRCSARCSISSSRSWFPVVSPENDLQMVDVHGCSSIFCICVGWLDDIPIYLTVDHHVSHHILSNIQNYDEKLKHLGISPIFDFNKVGIWIEFKRNAERKIDNKPARKLERI